MYLGVKVLRDVVALLLERPLDPVQLRVDLPDRTDVQTIIKGILQRLAIRWALGCVKSPISVVCIS